MERCVIRLLAVASTELARSPGLPQEDVTRFSAAESRFRSILQLLGDIRDRPAPRCPAVRQGSGGTVSVVDLFLANCRQWELSLPPWTIDTALIARAKDFLQTLDWHLPE